jgi:hypothetical protein
MPVLTALLRQMVLVAAADKLITNSKCGRCSEQNCTQILCWQSYRDFLFVSRQKREGLFTNVCACKYWEQLPSEILQITVLNSPRNSASSGMWISVLVPCHSTGKWAADEDYPEPFRLQMSKERSTGQFNFLLPWNLEIYDRMSHVVSKVRNCTYGLYVSTL